MRGYEKMTKEDFYNIPLYIPPEILWKYSDEELLELLAQGTKVCVILENKTLIPIKEYKGWI